MPRPMSPDCGTQKMSRPIRPPARYSAFEGPGTFVATAVALADRRSIAAAWTAAGIRPRAAISPSVSAGW